MQIYDTVVAWAQNIEIYTVFYAFKNTTCADVGFGKESGNMYLIQLHQMYYLIHILSQRPNIYLFVAPLKFC